MEYAWIVSFKTNLTHHFSSVSVVCTVTWIYRFHLLCPLEAKPLALQYLHQSKSLQDQV